MENIDARTSLEIIRDAAAKVARGEMTRDEYMKVYKTYCAKRKAEIRAKNGGQSESQRDRAV